MSDIPVGEPIVVDADTEEDLYSRGYLLCWDLLLTFFKAAPSEVKYISKTELSVNYYKTVRQVNPRDGGVIKIYDTFSLQMRAQYASFLRNLDAVDHLLANLFRLMPENPVIQLKDTLTSHSPNQKLSSVMSMFSRDPMLPVTGKNKVMDKTLWYHILNC